MAWPSTISRPRPFKFGRKGANACGTSAKKNASSSKRRRPGEWLEVNSRPGLSSGKTTRSRCARSCKDSLAATRLPRATMRLPWAGCLSSGSLLFQRGRWRELHIRRRIQTVIGQGCLNSTFTCHSCLLERPGSACRRSGRLAACLPIPQRGELAAPSCRHRFLRLDASAMSVRRDGSPVTASPCSR
jgi:hypothetical protein